MFYNIISCNSNDCENFLDILLLIQKNIINIILYIMVGPGVHSVRTTVPNVTSIAHSLRSFSNSMSLTLSVFVFVYNFRYSRQHFILVLVLNIFEVLIYSNVCTSCLNSLGIVLKSDSKDFSANSMQ